ncbi:MAG: DNA repair protein RecN [Muribaculaceae bacterium]|nr:DNA repair protein RecN [Muribaculaceae bacterium]
MLKRLSISNYALIDQLEIDFEQGLTIITGETGAGKSIILGALSLILGERADSTSIRDKERKTVVEATFDIEDYTLEFFFRDNDLDYYDGELIVRREINPNGRSRAFVNDGVVGLSTLKELMTRLVDIHSQHSNMLLSRPSFQLSILDNIAGHDEKLSEYFNHYNEYKATERQLNELRDNYDRNRSEEDYLRFQLNQLQETNLRTDEDEELEQQQRRLANATSLKEDLWKVINTLNSEDNSLIDQLQDVRNTLADAEENLDEVAGMSERVSNALIDLKDIAQSVGAIEESLNSDPALLQQVEERLNTIYSLERKHNVKTVNELIKLQEVYEHRLVAIDSSEERIAKLQELLESQRSEALQLAQVISDNRKKAAGEFASTLQPLAQNLGMKNLQFNIDFKPVELNAKGCDCVEFLFAFNKNQALMPVKDTASGGEISRLMLCIKSVIARSMDLPTIIFDEVDTGVSGEIAHKIGDMMGEISNKIQVIAITHLPQVAAHGDSHLRVFKTDTATQTITRVERLNDEEHVTEIARMLSGSELNQAAIENARALISASRCLWSKG